MDSVELLDNMLQSNSKSFPHLSSKPGNAELTESNNGTSIVVRNVPNGSIVIKVDNFRSPDAILCSSRGQCKRADYVIITDEQNGSYIVYIEMKKSKGKEQEVIEQFLGAQCFIHYCKHAACRFWKERNLLKKYNERFVSLSHHSVKKRPTGIKYRNGKNNQPEKMVKLWGSLFSFSEFI